MPYSEHKTFKLERGLTLEERKGESTLKARAHIKGKSHYFNTETTDFDRATRTARSWFFRLKGDHIPGSHEQVTMHAAAKAAIARIRNPARRETHQIKWNAISKFFKTLDVDAVDIRLLRQFVDSRTDVKPITIAHDLSTLRMILGYAVERGWRDGLPMFPRLEKSETNPRPWFTPQQLADLQQVAQERIEDAQEQAGKHRHSRMDLLDFIRLMIATGMRVGELRSVRVCDVKILRSSRITYGGRELPPGVAQHAKLPPDPNEYLEIELQEPEEGASERRLKRGVRTVVSRPATDGVATFRALVKRKGLKDEDLLFEDGQRDAFRELLKVAKLRTANGVKRNLKSLRCTAIMLWVLADPNVNLKLLADNFGTSTQMLDLFYLKPLNVKLTRRALVG